MCENGFAKPDNEGRRLSISFVLEPDLSRSKQTTIKKTCPVFFFLVSFVVPRCEISGGHGRGEKEGGIRSIEPASGNNRKRST